MFDKIPKIRLIYIPLYILLTIGIFMQSGGLWLKVFIFILGLFFIYICLIKSGLIRETKNSLAVKNINFDSIGIFLIVYSIYKMYCMIFNCIFNK